MAKIRLLVFILTLLVVGVFGGIAILYAKGYRLDRETLEVNPSGLLVTNSDPTGAQVIINGELKTATNATISLPPGIYDVTVKKESFIPWNKRLTIEREIVTQVNVVLFPSAPSLSALTFNGVANPIPSSDFTKIAYGVSQEGLWVLEAIDLPLGFKREPRQITDGDLPPEASWVWSPDSREILLKTKNAVFLLDTGKFTPQNQRVNVSSKVSLIEKDWEERRAKKVSAQLAKLPDELEKIFNEKTKDVIFSPDENKILYTASSSATISEGIVKALPGSSTQKQVRDIEIGKKYVLDIKEDRNFEVGEENQFIYWFFTSNHLVIAEPNKVSIMDYDGTNRQVVYAGSYIAPHAYPTPNTGRLLILTNLGSDSSPQNLYSLSLK